MPDMAHLLNVSADEVKELPVLPQGQYLAKVGQYEFDTVKITKGNNPGERNVIKVPLQLMQAISVMGAVPPRLPVLTETFWLTKDDGSQDEYTLDPIKRFIEACSISTAGRTIAEGMADTPNQMVTLDIGHRPNEKNPNRPFAQIKGIGKA